MSNRQVRINLLFDANTAAAQANIQSLASLLQQISSTRTTIGVDGGSMQQAVAAAQQLQISLQNAVNVDTGKINLIKLQSDLKASGTSLQTLTSQLRAVGPTGEQAFLKVAKAVSQAEVPMNKANGLIGNFMTTLANTAKWQIASSMIHGMIGMFQSACSHAKSLNKALTDIQIVTHNSDVQMAQFAKTANEAARALNTTSTEYAKAALIFYQQGLGGSDVIERADTVVKLSQVTGQSAETVSSQMTAIWNNFDDGSQSLEYYADVLTKLGAATAASTDEISQGLEKFAAIAGTVGMEYETAAAAIATVVAETRQSADVVGTAFKTIFARVQGLSLGESLEDGVDLNKYSSALAKVGVDILTASGELRDMDDILNDLGEKWQYLGSETQVALAQVVGGTRQYSQMIALMDNWDKITENINVAKDATGELAAQQETWSKSYEGSLKRLEQAKKELYETFVSDKLLIGWNDAISVLTKSFSTFVEKMGGVGPFVLSLVGIFSKTLFPLLMNGITKLSSMVSVATGNASRSVAAMQGQMADSLQQMSNNPNLTNGMRQQLELTQKLLVEKAKLRLSSSTMSEAQKVEAQSRLQVAEAMAAETMEILAQQDALEKQIRTRKEAMTSGKQKWDIARTSVETSFRERSAAAAGPDETETEKMDREAHDNWVLDRAANTGAGKLTSQIDAGEQFMRNQQQLQEWAPTVAKADAQAAAHEAISPEDLSIRDKARNLQAEQAKLLEKMGLAHGDINADVSNYVKGLTEARDVQREIHGIVNDTKGEGVAGAGVGRASIKKDTSDSMYEEGSDIQAVRANQLKGISGDSGGKMEFSQAEGGDESTLSMEASLNTYEQLYEALGKQKVLQGELASAIQEVKFVQDEKKAADDAVTAATNELTAAEEALKNASNGITQTQQKKLKNMTSQSKGFSKLTKAEQDYVKAQERVTAATKKQQKALQNQDKVLKTLPKNLAKSSKSYTDLAKKAGATDDQMDRLKSAFKNLESESADTDKEMGEIATVFKELGIASDGVAGDLVELGSNMATMLAKAGYSDEEIDQLTQAFLELANTTPQANNGLRGTGNALDGLNGKAPSLATSFGNMAQNAMTLAGNMMSLKSGIEGITQAFTEGGSAADIMQGILTGMMGILPTIIMLTKASKEAQDKKNKSTLEGVGADIAKTTSEGTKSAATWANTVANIANLLSNPWTMALAAVAVAAIAVVCGVMAAKTEQTEKDTQANLDNAKSQMEAVDKTQELATEVSALTEEYEKLSKAGKATTEVLEQMDEKIPELIASYRELGKSMHSTEGDAIVKAADELEHLYRVAQLTGDYSAYEAAQEELDTQVAQAEYNAAIAGGKAKGAQAATAMSDATNGSVDSKSGKMTLKLDGSDNSWGKGFWAWTGIGATESEYGVGNDKDTKLQDRTDEEKVAKSILKNKAGDYVSGGWSAGMFAKEQINLEIDYSDPGKFVESYDQLKEAQAEMERTMSQDQLANSDIYRELKESLEAGKEHYDEMLPMAEAQRDAGGKLLEAAMKEDGLDMSQVDTMDEYLKYRDEFIRRAQEEYNMTESQAEAYLKNAEGLSRVSDEYELASTMLSKFSGLSDEVIDNISAEQMAEYSAGIQTMLENTFGELTDEQMSIAVSIAATATDAEDFAAKMQQAIIVSNREAFQESANLASEAMASAVETGSFNLTSLFADDNFKAYMEDIGTTASGIMALSYEEQYRIVSEFYTKVNTLAFDSFTQQQELNYQLMASKQEELAAYHKAMKDNGEAVRADQEAYAELQKKYAAAATEAEKAELNTQMQELAANFENTYHFDIESNASKLQNEIDQLLASIEELQNQKIEMAMDWSGVDEVEAGMKKAAGFAKLIENDTKKVGNSYVMTAKQAREWLEFYPELGEIAETTNDGMISMDAARVEQFLANNDAELDSAIDTKITELEAEKEALQAELEMKSADLAAAQALAEGKREIEGTSAEYLTTMRTNLTDYFLELGMDEVQANAAALETMGLNEETYAQMVADSCEAQAENMAYASEDGANAQMDGLSQLTERWKNFGSYLINNIGSVLAELGKALLDPNYTVKDVFNKLWDQTKISVSANGSGHTYSTDDNGVVFDSGDEYQRAAVLKEISGAQLDSVNEDMARLQDAINSIDGQIDYLKALKEQDLSDYGNEDPTSGDSGGSDKTTEDLAEVAERYHEITREIEALERATERLGDQADRSYGKDKLKLMKEQQDALKAQYERQKDLLDLQSAFLAIDLENVKSSFEIEPVIDDDGNISNYTELLESATAKLNEARTAFNNSAQEEADQEALEAAEEAYEKQMELLEQYEETLDELNDQMDTVTESFYELQDLKLEELEYRLELKMEINDSDLARIDYYMAKMEDDFYQMAEAAALITGPAEAMGSGGSIGVNLNALSAQQDYLNALEEAYNKNEISQEAYVEGLKNGRDAIYENLTALQELDTTMMDYYGNTLAMAGEEIAKYASLVESSANALSYYSSIAALMGKETDYKYMGVILKSQADIAKNSYDIAKAQYDMLKNSADERKAAYDAAVANGAGQEELEMLEKQWWDAQSAVAEAQDTMLSNAEAWASSLRAILDNSLADLGKELENALAEGFGSFDAMNTAFERKNALQEEYLTTTNKIYETNKMMRTAQSEIDKSTNAAAKKRLKQFINETSALQDQTKLSQYELDIQQAKYNLLLAELALEEQQNAKSTVRLQRDNEGNFSYVYTANADKVSEAQQKFEDAQNALYNKGLEGANGYTEKYQQTMQEMYDTLTDLQNQYLEGAFESEEEYQNAIADAKQYYYEKLENYSRLYSVALSTDSQVAADAWTTEFASMTQETGKWMSSVNEYLTGTEKAFADFNSALSTIKNDVVGTNLEDMAENTKAIVDYSNQLAQEVTKEGGVIDALTNEISAVEDITEAYATFRDTLKEIETQYEQIAADADAAVKAAAGLPGVTTGQPGDGNTNEQAPGTTPTSTRDVSNLDWARVEAAYNKISNGDWGTGEEILSSGENAGYTEDEIETAKELAELIAGGETKESAKTILGFDTGGYTGDWAGSYGKLAFLHKKEMVLRPEDTSNFLASMEILERILQILDLQAVSAQLGGMLTSPTLSHQNDGVLEQNVHIEASFPGVQDHNEIELAISNLVNTASQFANRK